MRLINKENKAQNPNKSSKPRFISLSKMPKSIFRATGKLFCDLSKFFRSFGGHVPCIIGWYVAIYTFDIIDVYIRTNALSFSNLLFPAFMALAIYSLWYTFVGSQNWYKAKAKPFILNIFTKGN